MRITALLTVPLVAALIALPTSAPAQTIRVSFGARLGPEVNLSAYSSARMGEWRDNYRHWTPVTLYDVNGRYYRNSVRGARPVQVYSRNNEYFLPPQDQSWNGTDRRFNRNRQPAEADYGRARPYAPDAIRVDPRMGQEVGVLGYSEERAGNWRTNARRWTPVTLYEVNGRYYPRSGAGARPVAMYKYRNEYFLPPTDQQWVGFDKRYNYTHQPNTEDHGRVRNRP